MSGLIPTRMCSSGDAERRRSGAHMLLILFSPRPKNDLDAPLLDLSFSLPPAPGPFGSIRTVRAMVAVAAGSGGGVPPFQRPDPPGTRLGTCKCLRLQGNCALFRCSGLKPSRVRRAWAHSRACVMGISSGTLEHWNTLDNRYGYQCVSRSIARSTSIGALERRNAARQSIKIGGRYQGLGLIRAAQHLAARPAPRNFRADRAPVELGQAVDLGGSAADRPAAQEWRKTAVFWAPIGRVGTGVLECGGQVTDRTGETLRRPKLGRLTRADAPGISGWHPGASIAATPPGAPNRVRLARPMLAHAIFWKPGHRIDAQIADRAEILKPKNGSGASPVPRRCRSARGARQLPAYQNRVGDQSGVLVPPAKAGGERTLAGGAAHVN